MRLSLLLLLAALALGQVPPDSVQPDPTRPDSAATPRPAYRLVTDGPVRVDAKLLPVKGKKKLTVGDRFDVELVVRRPKDLRVSPPVSPNLEPFAVTGQQLTTRYKGDTTLDIYRLTMAGFAAGDLKVPPLLVTWPVGNELVAAQSESIPVTIISVLPAEMKDINELKPQAQFPDWLPLWLGLGLLAAAALGFVGWRFYRRCRRGREMPEAMADPWDEALAALGAVPVIDWLEKGQLKRYYYTVSEILKRYLTRRFEFPAIDQTTTEIVRAMKLGKVPERDRFAEFFYRADMVKYAKFVPERAESDGLVDSARTLVYSTTPQPVLAGQAEMKAQ